MQPGVNLLFAIFAFPVPPGFAAPPRSGGGRSPHLGRRQVGTGPGHSRLVTGEQNRPSRAG